MRLAMLLSILSILIMISCGEDPVQVQEKSKNIKRPGDVSKTELCQLESFEIYGENFDKYEETIQVLFNNTPVQILNVSKDALLISIPETQDSVGTLTVLKGSDSVKIDHEIRIKPEICVDVTSLLKYEVVPGEVLLGKGNGLGKYKGVMKAIIESQEASLEVISDSECTVNIPELNYGTYEIKFLVGTEVVGEFKILVKGEAGSLAFEITTIKPREVYKGDVFTVRGKGFGSDLEQCKVYVESYTKDTYKAAEIVSLTDNKIEAKVPFEALYGEVKIKIKIGHAEKLLTQTLEVVRSNFKYNKLSLTMSGISANQHFQGTRNTKSIDYYEYDNIEDIEKELAADSYWIGDSISWTVKENKNETHIFIELDSVNKKIARLYYEENTEYSNKGNSSYSSSEKLKLELQNLRYEDIEGGIRVQLNKESIKDKSFNLYYYCYKYARVYGEYSDSYDSETTGEYKFSDDFELTIILSK